MRRILILYGFEHSGHHAAALALRDAFLMCDREVRVDLLNFFAYSCSLLERVVTNLFFRVVKSTPQVWDGIYRDPRSETGFGAFRKVIRTFSTRGVEDALSRYSPDAIVCTQAFPCGMVSDYRAGGAVSPPLYAVLTDFFVPSYWMYDQVDRYFVACASARSELIAGGASSSTVTDSGIPVHPHFMQKPGIGKARALFGLPEDSFTVLVMGGWSGWGELERLASAVKRRNPSCTVAVVTGRNSELYQRLCSTRYCKAGGLRVFPYVSRMDILMGAADLLVGKAGGMTAAEALASELPIILVDSLPGQERANEEYLCRAGAACAAGSGEDAAALVKALSSDGARLGAMKSAARALGRAGAAASIAGAILERRHAAVHCV